DGEVCLVIDLARTSELINYINTGNRSKYTYRDFRHLLFVGVVNFDASGNWCTEKGRQHGYSSKFNTPLVLQDYNIRRVEKFCVNFYFARSRECKFMFDFLKIEQRKGRAAERGNEYVYYDIESGEEFDFYEPFTCRRT